MENRRERWERRFGHPAVLASIIGGIAGLGVALASAISGSISASYQADTERIKLKANMLLVVSNLSDPTRADAVLILIRSGILEDSDGKVCRAFVLPVRGVGDCKPLN
jgi:hypothetical protein